MATVTACAEVGGSMVAISAETMLSGGAELASIEWTIDSSSAGSGEPISNISDNRVHFVTTEFNATDASGNTDNGQAILLNSD